MLRLTVVQKYVRILGQEVGFSVAYAMAGFTVHVLVCYGEMPKRMITFTNVVAAQLYTQFHELCSYSFCMTFPYMILYVIILQQ